ncbi:hypothetical protein KAFR_0D01460 [Kazachstania africana CBS 2517]|uniref:Phospholipid/glycerol acyltransferase domain-containing protein n=1 Tax=Kazachstania africana (strain ATCC 22294 / BCRC 22015 / CBS 2517 / CECT 1963 / NBRC 1671 / NRRL Y-8276) TaxID=1071382 RepID=H2ATU2_KAZAF|nr:hypothetical protein KAFR_0D01460 [Kazachstania africana CBS 2517]CCF57792.1 hypothetical protein KAFR_0D01460 [Kazachstania africana CBS 2517]
MGITDFLKVHIAGSDFNLRCLSLDRKKNIVFEFSQLILYVVAYIIVSKFQYGMLFILNSKISRRVYRLYCKFWYYIPILGVINIGIANSISNFLFHVFPPFLNRISTVLEVLFYYEILQMTFSKEGNIKIYFTNDSEELLIMNSNQLLTTLIISNHRSVVDYILINVLLYRNFNGNWESMSRSDILKRAWNETLNIHPQAKFISWGDIFKLPTLYLLINILTKNENHVIDSGNIIRYLNTWGNQVFVLFPEVNILTTELGIIQRKINQNYYPHVMKYYNVLYPRYKMFVNVINAFAQLCDIKKSLLNRKLIYPRHIISEATVRISNKVDKILKEDDSIPLVFGNYESVGQQNELLINSKDQKIFLNKYLYDLSVVYYKAKVVEKSHDHVKGTLKPQKGVQLEQIVPSLFDIFFANYKRGRDPIIVIVDIRRHRIDQLLPLKNEKLEKWLEILWMKKERLIIENEAKISLK